MQNQDKPIGLEIFRGQKDDNGKVTPLRRVGKCLFYQGTGTHVLHVDLFPGQTHKFYLKPAHEGDEGQFRICIKEPWSQDPTRMINRPVGMAMLCDSPNEDLLYLEWDFIGAADIYMKTISVQTDEEKLSA